MNHLLKAMGFWIWGLVAIGLSVSVVSVGYRFPALYRAHEIQARTDSGPTLAPSALNDLRDSDRKPAAPSMNSPGSRSDQRVISRILAADIRSAQQALRDKQWSEALKNLDGASTKSPLTSYDSKTIEEFKGFAYVRLNNPKAAQTAYEAALATGAYRADELAKVFHLLFQLAATNKQDAKAIDYGERAVAAGAARDSDLLIMSQLYYQQKDCKNSVQWGDRAIDAFRVAGDPPKEVLYQIKLQCAADANDTSGMKAALYDLIRLTNKTSYWNNLLRLERQDERDDHNTLMIYRVMFDTHSMNADTDYIEMAQLLGDAGLPGEAQTVLEKSMGGGALRDEHKERIVRLLSSLKARVEAQQDGLAALDAEAGGNRAGTLDVKLGEIYFGGGDYGRAASFINRGIGKGQLLRPDEAYVSLGRSLAAESDPAGAKQAFGKLKSLPEVSPRVLKLWNLYADMMPEKASDPL